MVSRKPFPLLNVMPESLRGVVLAFLWSREQLWEHELPVQTVAVQKLRWHLALPMWSFEGVPFTVSPEQVRTNPNRYHVQVRTNPNRYHVQHARTLAADLAFPLHALVRPGGHLTLLDGVHRLLKADLLGHTTVAGRHLRWIASMQ